MKNIILVLFVITNLLSCTQKEKTTKFSNVTFEVNDSLLAEEFCCADLKLNFKPPLGWKEVNFETLESIKANALMSQDTLQISVVPLKIFINRELSFTCFVSSLNSNFIDDYITKFLELNNNLQINEAQFSHNVIDFHQLIFSKNGLITIKLIVKGSDNKSFMIDYIMPAKHYEENLHAVESSIGTIKIGG